MDSQFKRLTLTGLCLIGLSVAAPIHATAESGDAAADVRSGPEPIKPTEHGVGRLIENVSFTDLDGATHRLSDFADHKATVIAMTGTGCPLCKKYSPTLARLQSEFQDKDVAFVLVNPNESESVAVLREAIQTHGFSGLYVRDDQEVLTRALGATTTTEVFVLDAARTLVYRGAVDDQYSFGYALDAPKRNFLADALTAVLAGERPEVAATTAPGCELLLVEIEDTESTDSAAAVTFHNRVSRVLQDNCQQCHRDNGLAPFPLTTYEDTKDYAAMIANVVQRQIMPPWFAAPHNTAESKLEIRWSNDRSLPQEDRDALLAWVAAGAPEGDEADAPLPRRFSDEWEIGQPDLIVEIPDPITVKASGQMPYRHARVATSFAEDRWVQAVEIQPTDRAVVHHVLVFIQDGKKAINEDAGFFAAYVPGNTSQRYPTGMAKKLPAGSSLVFQLHYTPNGTETVDQTRLGIVFADKPPTRVIRNAGISNHRISIPAGAGNHPESASLKVPTDVRVLSFMPHMHLRGKAFRYTVTMPDGQREVLLDVPRYDFNWQLEYRLAQPLDIPKGSQIDVTGWFDNSESNPANPDPTETVRWGPQTDDEMLLGYVEYFVTTETAASDSDESPASDDVSLSPSFLEKSFQRADQNGDGKVTREEFPRPLLFRRLDRNNDGVLLLDEVLESSRAN
ncbi:redoxin family protein [Stieleria varia]|uniref:Thiol-disulfide oxidoreductase n=1 Tax=Stieleria varia TaxID=2528005 RepID=A0A5C6A5J5_9BACT|nr:redoxin family protein [Stieleria varia]TWT94587.1 thiol-disulfide oxidoreductase [Stieleria varia]